MRGADFPSAGQPDHPAFHRGAGRSLRLVYLYSRRGRDSVYADEFCDRILQRRGQRPEAARRALDRLGRGLRAAAAQPGFRPCLQAEKRHLGGHAVFHGGAAAGADGASGAGLHHSDGGGPGVCRLRDENGANLQRALYGDPDFPDGCGRVADDQPFLPVVGGLFHDQLRGFRPACLFLRHQVSPPAAAGPAPFGAGFRYVRGDLCV